MNNRNAYIMQEQVHNLIPALMSCDITQEKTPSKPPLHLVSIAVVSVAYLLAMALSN